MTSRKKPGVAFWATVAVVVVPLLYVLSFGPACWITDQDWCPIRLHDAHYIVYWPMLRLLENGPAWLADAIMWWVGMWEGD
jgi:hypothetical protein